jgi:hypothetical protein
LPCISSTKSTKSAVLIAAGHCCSMQLILHEASSCSLSFEAICALFTDALRAPDALAPDALLGEDSRARLPLSTCLAPSGVSFSCTADACPLCTGVDSCISLSLMHSRSSAAGLPSMGRLIARQLKARCPCCCGCTACSCGTLRC